MVATKQKQIEWPTQGSSEIDINQSAEPRYRVWVKERTTRTSKPLYTEEAIYGGAEAIGISPTTTRRYLGKMTSPQGDFLLVPLMDQGRRVRQVVYKHKIPRKLHVQDPTDSNTH